MYQAAKAVQNDRKISDYVDAGGVAAAILFSHAVRAVNLLQNGGYKTESEWINTKGTSNGTL